MQKVFKLLVLYFFVSETLLAQLNFPVASSVTPVGADGRLQYNSNGSMAAMSTVSSNDTCLIFTPTSAPSVPSGDAVVYTPTTTPLLRFATDNIDRMAQIHLGFTKRWEFRPFGAASTTVGTIGGTSTTSGTAAGILLGAGDEYEGIRRLRYTSSATAGNVSHVRAPAPYFCIGGANYGGFYASFIFAFSSMTATGRGFTGMGDFSATPSATTTLANTLNIIGIGQEAGASNMSLYHNDGSGTATQVDLGASFPGSSGIAYKLELFAAPGASSVTYRVIRLSNGTTTTGTLSSNLPAGSTMIGPCLFNSNGATASSVGLEVGYITAFTFL